LRILTGEVLKMGEIGNLDEADRKTLLQTARSVIADKLSGSGGGAGDTADGSPQLQEPRGTFVTLTKNGSLRGCIGHLAAREPLIEGVRQNAVNAAFKDPRFPPLSRDELDRVKIEVSVLTEPVPLEHRGGRDLLEKLQPGVDGVIIKKGGRQATFLPQVWEQLPDKEQFLSHLCLKAGLPADAWSSGDLEVSTYRVEAFEED
jgi:AmmeMemoRadiSam system protein A